MLGREPIDVDRLIAELKTDFEPAAIAKGLEIRTRTSNAIVLSDATALRRILGNLIDNGIRYTERGGVLIGCRHRTDSLLICVVDMGCGIPIHEQQHVFEEFYQLGNVERNREGGLGLGLAIVKRLATIMQLRLGLRSRPGRGTCFSLSLPITARPLSLAPVTVEAALVNLQRPRTIIVIDDDIDVLQAMVALLATWNYRVIASLTLDKALAVPDINAADALIVDYRLQRGITGDVAISQLREKLGRNLPALIVTGGNVARAFS